MKVGVVFPQTEIGDHPQAISAYAQHAEELGYDYLLAYDHVLGANPDRPGGWQGRPYTYKSMFHEPLVLFAYLAGITRKLEFATGILILPQRQTALVAKQAAQVDLLSGGRLRLGIGIGWNDLEYQSLNQEFHTRGRRSEEQVSLLRLLWTQPLVVFDGAYHTVADAGINPLPIQRPIPIWFGGGADRLLRRAARLGDGWMPNSMPVEHLTQMVGRLRAYLVEAGREPERFGLDCRISIKPGNEKQWAAEIGQMAALGATHLCVNTMGAGLAGAEEHMKAIGRFKDHVDSLDLAQTG